MHLASGEHGMKYSMYTTAKPLTTFDRFYIYVAAQGLPNIENEC